MNPVLAELTKSDKFNEYLERIKKSNAPISILGLAGVGTLQIVASTEENIKRLYGNTLKTSVSRLEQYRECPFSFHLKS